MEMDKVLNKLGYKDQGDILIMNAPEEILSEILPLLAATPQGSPEGSYSFIMVFARSLEEVEALKSALAKALKPQGRLWICYPKRSSKRLRCSLSRDVLWDAFAEFDMEPVSNFSIDQDWSSIRFRPVDEIRSLKRKTSATAKGRERTGQ